MSYIHVCICLPVVCMSVIFPLHTYLHIKHIAPATSKVCASCAKIVLMCMHIARARSFARWDLMPQQQPHGTSAICTETEVVFRVGLQPLLLPAGVCMLVGEWKSVERNDCRTAGSRTHTDSNADTNKLIICACSCAA